MKHSKVAASTLALAILLGTALPALADEGSNENETEIEASSSTEIHAGFPGANFLQGIRDRIQNKVEDREERRASTSQKIEDKKAEIQDHREQELEDRGASEIDKRIEALTKLKDRLSGIKLIDSSILANILAGIDTQIASLEALKTQITSGTATSTLKTDVQSITKGFRTFALVEPKAHIAASASRINAVVTQMTAFADKLQARIDAAKAAGTDTASAETALADMKTQLADAKAQADAAVSETENLQPDNGDATVRASNLAALKDARAKLVTAAKDLAKARHDIAQIYAVVKGSGGSSAEATTTASTTTP